MAVAVLCLSPVCAESASPEVLEPLLRELSVRPLWGDPPPLALPALDGQRRALDGLRGRVVLLYFWATWCPICTGELPSAIEALHREFGPQGLEVLAISMQEPRDHVVRWLRAHPLSVPVLLDQDGAASRAYRAAGTPTFVLVDRSGQLVGRGVGAREWTGERGLRLVRALLGAGTR